jgi:hypothetical protein
VAALLEAHRRAQSARGGAPPGNARICLPAELTEKMGASRGPKSAQLGCENRSPATCAFRRADDLARVTHGRPELRRPPTPP